MRSSLVSLGARETLALKQWARGATFDRAAGESVTSVSVRRVIACSYLVRATR